MQPWAYFDTSVIVKLYVEEVGSQEVGALVRRYRLLSSVLLPLEVSSAFARRKDSEELSPGDFRTGLGRFQDDRQFFEWVELTQAVRHWVESFLQTHAIRTLDAIHIASALVFKERAEMTALPFVTGDRRQLLAAQALGLETVWVGE